MRKQFKDKKLSFLIIPKTCKRAPLTTPERIGKFLAGGLLYWIMRVKWHYLCFTWMNWKVTKKSWGWYSRPAFVLEGKCGNGMKFVSLPTIFERHFVSKCLPEESCCVSTGQKSILVFWEVLCLTLSVDIVCY